MPDLRTRGIVLRRTNYRESDRILDLLTPEGKQAVLARGVRKAKSRLAGGIELFTLSEVVIHQGRGSLGTLTSAKMLQFYDHLLGDLSRLELASGFLRQLARVTEQTTSPEYFSLLAQALTGLNRAYPSDLVHIWFQLNLARISGEDINLICDASGTPLDPAQSYRWDATAAVLRPDPAGPLTAREIKLARFLLARPLAHATKITQLDRSLPALLPLARTFH